MRATRASSTYNVVYAPTSGTPRAPSLPPTVSPSPLSASFCSFTTIPAPEGAAVRRVTRETPSFASHPPTPVALHFSRCHLASRDVEEAEEEPDGLDARCWREKESALLLLSQRARIIVFLTLDQAPWDRDARERFYALRKYPPPRRERKHSSGDTGLDQY